MCVKKPPHAPPTESRFFPEAFCAWHSFCCTAADQKTLGAFLKPPASDRRRLGAFGPGQKGAVRNYNPHVSRLANGKSPNFRCLRDFRLPTTDR